MVRKYGKRRGLKNRRRRYARMPRRSLRTYNPLRKSVHWFKEMCQITSIVGTAATPASSGIMTFKLNDLQNAGSFKALFDLYKITGVKLKLVPRFSTSDAIGTNAGGSMGNLPVLYIAPNRDPFVPAPTSIGDILNDDGCKVIRLTKPVNLYLKSPKAVLLDTSEQQNILPFQFGTAKAFQPWLTTGGNSQIVDQSNIQHYGYRWVINNQAGADCVLDVYATYYFTCKEQD